MQISTFCRRRGRAYVIYFYITTFIILTSTTIVIWRFRHECYSFPIPPNEEHFKKCGNVQKNRLEFFGRVAEPKLSFAYKPVIIKSGEGRLEEQWQSEFIQRDLGTGNTHITEELIKRKVAEKKNQEVRDNVMKYFEERQRYTHDACLNIFAKEESINLDTTNDEALLGQLKKLERIERGENRFFMKTAADKRTNWIFYNHHDPLNELEIQWCPIYKSASTPWMAIFTKLSKALTRITEAKIRSGKITFVKLARDFRLYVAKPETISDDSIRYSMVVVRHPFQRLLSAYRDKLERIVGREYYNKKYSKNIIKRFRKSGGNADVATTHDGLVVPLWYKMALDVQQRYNRPSARQGTIKSVIFPKPQNASILHTPVLTPSPLVPKIKHKVTETPTFEEFCKYLLSVDPKVMDEHWRPQYLDCSPCHHKFNFILQVEELEKDKFEIFKLLGFDDISSPEYKELEAVWNRWTNPSTSLHNESYYFSQLSESIIQDLYHLYELDFELFGYSPDDYFDMVRA